MTLREALITAIEVLREQGDRDRRFTQAEKVLHKKAARLGEQREARAHRHLCPRCGRNTDNLLCVSCWHSTPYELRVQFRSAKTEAVKCAAIRAVLSWAKANREAA